MPDLLPQQSSNSSPGMAARMAGGDDPSGRGMQEKQKSFLSFGFSAEAAAAAAANSAGARRDVPPGPGGPPQVGPNVNVTPTSHDMASDTPEIRKYKKRFNSEILCAALWGVNLLIGTENGLMLLDRSGQGKVYQLISRRRFQQMD